jgi:hypothetical protein
MRPFGLRPVRECHGKRVPFRAYVSAISRRPQPPFRHSRGIVLQGVQHSVRISGKSRCRWHANVSLSSRHEVAPSNTHRVLLAQCSWEDRVLRGVARHAVEHEWILDCRMRWIHALPQIARSRGGGIFACLEVAHRMEGLVDVVRTSSVPVVETQAPIATPAHARTCRPTCIGLSTTAAFSPPLKRMHDALFAGALPGRSVQTHPRIPGPPFLASKARTRRGSLNECPVPEVVRLRRGQPVDMFAMGRAPVCPAASLEDSPRGYRG